ncbi:MAG: hypothetical protein AVDCRST_MAG88-2555, partial [uncultured Thermomicrobiales bacterium]
WLPTLSRNYTHWSISSVRRTQPHCWPTLGVWPCGGVAMSCRRCTPRRRSPASMNCAATSSRTRRVSRSSMLPSAAGARKAAPGVA